MTRTTAWSLFALLVIFSLVTVVPPAFADNESPIRCSDYVGLTNKISDCIRHSVDRGAQVYFKEFYPKLQQAIGAGLTLAVIVYGIMLAYGMVEKVGRDTLILLFKISGVIYFCANSDFIYRSATDMMDNAALAVISYAPTHGKADSTGSDFDQATCLKNMTDQQGGASGKMSGPWLGVDCLVDTVIGIKAPDAKDMNGSVYFNKLIEGKNEGMSRGLLYLFFSGVQSSVMGGVLGIIGFIFIWGLIALIIKTLFIYLAGYIGVAFMSIISPLFIPMILFQHTRQYFDKWFKSFFSFALQPIIMMAFVTFSITAVDFAAFSGDYSIWYRIAGEASRKKDFDLNAYLTKPRKEDGSEDKATPPDGKSVPIIGKVDKPVVKVKTSSPTPDKSAVTSTDKGGISPGLNYTNCTADNIAKDPNLKLLCSFSYDISLSMNQINWPLMAKVRSDPAVEGATDEEKGKAIANEVLSSIAFCALVVFLLSGFLKLIPLIAYDITGDFGQSANISQAVAGKWAARGEMDKITASIGKLSPSLGKLMGK